MPLRETIEQAIPASERSLAAPATQNEGSNVTVFWAACLAQLERELPAQQFNTWIRGLRMETNGAPDQLYLLAPNRFVLQWVRERYLAQIQELSQKHYPVPVTISLGLSGD